MCINVYKLANFLTALPRARFVVDCSTACSKGSQNWPWPNYWPSPASFVVQGFICLKVHCGNWHQPIRLTLYDHRRWVLNLTDPRGGDFTLLVLLVLLALIVVFEVAEPLDKWNWTDTAATWLQPNTLLNLTRSDLFH